MTQKSLTIVVINFNSFFWIKQLLTSLKEFYLDKTERQVDVVIVDNGSSDDSLQQINEQFGQYRIVKSPENIGFAAGNNLVLKDVKTPYVLLLNNDIQLTANSNFDLLIKFMEKNAKLAVVSPKVILNSGELDKACHRGEPTPWASFTYFSGLEKILPGTKQFGQYHQSYKKLDESHLVDAVSGAAMLVRKKAIDQIGLLDERFFMYAEDLDWCKRFRDKGWQIGFFPFVEVIHHKYKSGIKSTSSQTATKIKKMFYDTMLIYYDKHYRESHPEWMRNLIRLVLFIKRGGI